MRTYVLTERERLSAPQSPPEETTERNLGEAKLRVKTGLSLYMTGCHSTVSSHSACSSERPLVRAADAPTKGSYTLVPTFRPLLGLTAVKPPCRSASRGPVVAIGPDPG